MATTRTVRFHLIRSLHIADYITLLNAFCGVFAIFYSMQNCFIAAYVLIFLGYVLDIFDGKVARWRNECSLLGRDLDTLSDLITFGVAPAVMSFSVGFKAPLDQIVLGFYVLCAVARLARFNVTEPLIPKSADGKRLYYEGLSIPFACLAVSTAIAFCVWTNSTSEILLAGVVLPGTYCEFHPAMISIIAVSSMIISKRLRVLGGGVLGMPTMTIAKLSRTRK